ncbi:hypothetical protein K502DRAFT_346597 [Neoconidiobolus thromboides FSU 785]|nr:hypothetical protein K502DRAFT_346597 [Neoconidiobolus thromboides FSU 785]
MLIHTLFSGSLYLLSVLLLFNIQLIVCENVDIPIVDVKECSLVYKYKDVHIMGCTDMDSEGLPWCMLKNSKSKQTWGYCDMNSITAYFGDDNGIKKDCDVSSHINDTKYLVYGCYSKDNKNYQCKSNDKPISCLIKLNDKDYKRPNVNATSTGTVNVKNNKGPDSNSIEKIENEDSNSLQVILILSILGSIGLISVIVLFFMARKRNQKAKKELQELNNNMHPNDQHSNKLEKLSSISTLINHNNIIPATNDNKQYKELMVISTYKPTLSDELIIKPGDKVVVYKEYDDGWCQGANLTRGGVKGVFPKHCVEPLSDSSLSSNKYKVTKRCSSNIYNSLPKSANI